MLNYSNNSIWEMSIFYKWKYYFRHLKLEIALAIPAANDEKFIQTILQLKGIYKIELKLRDRSIANFATGEISKTQVNNTLLNYPADKIPCIAATPRLTFV